MTTTELTTSIVYRLTERLTAEEFLSLAFERAGAAIKNIAL